MLELIVRTIDSGSELVSEFKLISHHDTSHLNEEFVAVNQEMGTYPIKPLRSLSLRPRWSWTLHPAAPHGLTAASA